MELIVARKEREVTKPNDTARVYCLIRKNENIPRARLVMMNFLHCSNLPSWVHVHHINKPTTDDDMENLQFTNCSQHISIHHPKDYKFGISYSDDSTGYERGRRKQDHVKKTIAATSLRWYHRNKTSVNANPDKKIYKKSWYSENKERIIANLKKRYDTEPAYRAYCIEKARIQKQTKRRECNETLQAV